MQMILTNPIVGFLRYTSSFFVRNFNRFFFSFLCCLCISSTLFGQENTLSLEKQPKEKNPYFAKDFYIGIETGKLLRSIASKERNLTQENTENSISLGKNYSGFSVESMMRLTQNNYLSTSIGYESNLYVNEYLVQRSKGSYFDMGIDHNLYKNWKGMRDLITVGGRIGISQSQQSIKALGVHQRSNYFGLNYIQIDENDTDYSYTQSEAIGVWVSLVFGLHVELFKNVFCTSSVYVNNTVYTTTQENMDNLFLPGYGKTNDFQSINFRFTYSIRYAF